MFEEECGTNEVEWNKCVCVCGVCACAFMRVCMPACGVRVYMRACVSVWLSQRLRGSRIELELGQNIPPLLLPIHPFPRLRKLIVVGVELLPRFKWTNVFLFGWNNQNTVFLSAAWVRICASMFKISWRVMHSDQRRKKKWGFHNNGSQVWTEDPGHSSVVTGVILRESSCGNAMCHSQRAGSEWLEKHVSGRPKPEKIDFVV